MNKYIKKLLIECITNNLFNEAYSILKESNNCYAKKISYYIMDLPESAIDSYLEYEGLNEPLYYYLVITLLKSVNYDYEELLNNFEIIIKNNLSNEYFTQYYDEDYFDELKEFMENNEYELNNIDINDINDMFDNYSSINLVYQKILEQYVLLYLSNELEGFIDDNIEDLMDDYDINYRCNDDDIEYTVRGLIFKDGSYIALSDTTDHRIVSDWDENDIITYDIRHKICYIRIHNNLSGSAFATLDKLITSKNDAQIYVEYYKNSVLKYNLKNKSISEFYDFVEEYLR
jgi:hypothetical protein